MQAAGRNLKHNYYCAMVHDPNEERHAEKLHKFFFSRPPSWRLSDAPAPALTKQGLKTRHTEVVGNRVGSRPLHTNGSHILGS
jgi:hypothetical protein